MNRTRLIAAVLAFALATLITPIGIVSFWAHRTITDSQRFVETMGPLSDSIEVQDAVAEVLTEKFQQQVDPKVLVNDIFGQLTTEYPRLRIIEPVIAGAIDSLIREVSYRIVRSDSFSQVWQAAIVTAQRSIMAVLQGREDSAVELDGDNIVLNISGALEAVKQGLIARGFTAAERITIPPRDESIVLVEAPQLKQLRTVYSIASPVLMLLLFVGLGLFILAVVLSQRRPRMVAWVGFVLTIIGGVLAIVLEIGRTTFTNALAGTPLGPASDVFYQQLFVFLINAAAVTIVLGVIVMVIGWYLSRSRSAAEVRGVVDRGAQTVADAIGPGPLTNIGPWLTRNARWVRVGIAVFFIAVVVIGRDLSVWRTVVAAIVSLALLAILQVLTRAHSRELEPTS